MSSDIDIASNALQMIGAEPISSFDDPGAGAAVAKALYEPLLRALLTRTYWRFAIKKQSLNKLSQTPLNEYKYAYQIPTDCLKVEKVYVRSFYKVFRDLIYSNVDNLDIDYVYRVDTPALPSYFELAFTYHLAAEFSLSVTDDVNKNQLYSQKFFEALGAAYTADSQQNPQTPIQDNPFTDVRFSGGFGNGPYF